MMTLGRSTGTENHVKLKTVIGVGYPPNLFSSPSEDVFDHKEIYFSEYNVHPFKDFSATKISYYDAPCFSSS